MSNLSSVTSEHRRRSFWVRLSEVERSAVVQRATVEKYAKGATLMSAGEVGDTAAVIHRGQVRVVGAGGRAGLANRFAGDIVGEQAMLDGQVRSATVLADSPVQALVLPNTALSGLIELHPGVLRVLCAVLSERLCESDRVLGNQLDNALTKVVDFLVRTLDDSRERGDRWVSINIKSQAELATRLAVSRASVVRALSALRRDGCITTGRRGVVVVVDPDALRAGNKRVRECRT
ncbi:Crp/Fnr family transcriptional regulator [Actinokineospora sp. PR83]|uniref:Crp/Fnr family transcriptional regulator n=1 Tax=Actinokineospora sp. PR83 TaxID=2884908 RepID=UPI0027E19866|nr:Crp/Fnr family transcriptional regulator [Actinokineospora sp. PR83]MCG8916279.1 Crp/Fnr family transcriptional regulator [Actinokineospora sp. PR83]